MSLVSIDQKTDAETLREMRDLLAVISREAANRGHIELVDQVKRTDDLAAGMLKRRTS